MQRMLRWSKTNRRPIFAVLMFTLCFFFAPFLIRNASDWLPETVSYPSLPEESILLSRTKNQSIEEVHDIALYYIKGDINTVKQYIDQHFAPLEVVSSSSGQEYRRTICTTLNIPLIVENSRCFKVRVIAVSNGEGVNIEVDMYRFLYQF